MKHHEKTSLHNGADIKSAVQEVWSTERNLSSCSAYVWSFGNTQVSLSGFIFLGPWGC